MSKFSKEKFSCRGFTLIEIVVVVGLILCLAITSVAFSLPALATFSCDQEVRTISMVVERARNISQFDKKGNIEFKIATSTYEILARDNEGEVYTIDQVESRSAIVVTTNQRIVFEEKTGAFVNTSSGEMGGRLDIGGSEFGCHKIITINNAGAIF